MFFQLENIPLLPHFFDFLCFYEFGRRMTSLQLEGLLLYMFIPCVGCICLVPLAGCPELWLAWPGGPGALFWGSPGGMEELKSAWARAFLSLFAQRAPSQDSWSRSGCKPGGLRALCAVGALAHWWELRQGAGHGVLGCSSQGAPWRDSWSWGGHGPSILCTGGMLVSCTGPKWAWAEEIPGHCAPGVTYQVLWSWGSVGLECSGVLRICVTMARNGWSCNEHWPEVLLCAVLRPPCWDSLGWCGLQVWLTDVVGRLEYSDSAPRYIIKCAALGVEISVVSMSPSLLLSSMWPLSFVGQKLFSQSSVVFLGGIAL